jgi:hypothetical protein
MLYVAVVGGHSGTVYRPFWTLVSTSEQTLTEFFKMHFACGSCFSCVILCIAAL